MGATARGSAPGSIWGAPMASARSSTSWRLRAFSWATGRNSPGARSISSRPSCQGVPPSRPSCCSSRWRSRPAPLAASRGVAEATRQGPPGVPARAATSRTSGMPRAPLTRRSRACCRSGAGAWANFCSWLSSWGSLVSQQGLPRLRPSRSTRPGPSCRATRPPARFCRAITRPPTSWGACRGSLLAPSRTRPSPALRGWPAGSTSQPPASIRSRRPTQGPRFLLQRPCTSCW